MKRNLTINRLALGSLRAHKRQYLSLAGGIMLAIFFASTLILMVQSVYFNYRELHYARTGRQDAIVTDVSEESLDIILRSGMIDPDAGRAYVTGVNARIGYTMGYYDGNGLELSSRALTEGRMPAAPGEIAVEPVLLQRLRLDAGVGDSIELSYSVPVQDGLMPEPVTRSYTVVGILTDVSRWQNEDMAYTWDRTADNMRELQPSALIWPGEGIEPGGYPILHALLRGAPGVSARDIWARIYELEALNNTGYSGVYCYEFTLGGDITLLMSIAVLGLVLVIAACVGIVNSFSMNLSRRRSQIGMLRAVGATSRQIRSIFGREALAIALVTTPVAIGLSYLAAWGLMRLLGEGMSLITSPLFLPLDVALSLMCVMLAAAIPLMSASRISPMQAIRETTLMRARKRVRVKPLSRYSVPGLLAQRHLKLYRSKRVGVTAMIALSLFILTFGSYIVMDMMTGNNGTPEWDYEVQPTSWINYTFVMQDATRPGLTEYDVQEALRLPMVAEVHPDKTLAINMRPEQPSEYLIHLCNVTSSRYLYDRSITDLKPWEHTRLEQYDTLRRSMGVSEHLVTLNMGAFAPEVIALLEPYVLEGGLDIDALNAGREVLVIAPMHFYEKRVYNSDGGYSSQTEYEPAPGFDHNIEAHNDTFFAGDELHLTFLYTDGVVEDSDIESLYTLTGVKRTDCAPRTGAIIAPQCLGNVLSGGSGWTLHTPSIVTTLSGLKALGLHVGDYTGMVAALSGEPDSFTLTQLDEGFERIARRTAHGEMRSQISNAHAHRSSSMWIVACIAAIVALFFSISVSMVNNSITNRIRSDRRSIGTLRAVGAPLDVIISSYRRQLLSMLLWGALIGIGSGYALILYMMLAMRDVAWFMREMSRMTGAITLAYAVFLGLMALICTLNLRARVRAVARASIVDNIREL